MTATESARTSATRSNTGTPMLPISREWRPSASRMWWISEAVVDLPLVPVTPIVRQVAWRRNRSVCDRIASPAGSVTPVSGMPGDLRRQSNPCSRSR